MRTPTSNTGNMARLRGLLAAMLVALIGIFSSGIATAAQSEQTWSVFVHIRYVDGFVYEHAFATGVPTSELSGIMADCGNSHKWGAGSAVHYHCFAQPE